MTLALYSVKIKQIVTSLIPSLSLEPGVSCCACIGLVVELNQLFVSILLTCNHPI